MHFICDQEMLKCDIRKGKKFVNASCIVICNKFLLTPHDVWIVKLGVTKFP